MGDWIASHGGWVGLGVLGAKYSLILFSIVSVAVIIERVLGLRRARRLEIAEYPRLRAALEAKNEVKLRAIAASSAAPCAAIVETGWEYQGASEARLREAMNQETSAQIALLGSNLPVLATAASTSPYVGLFGTVLGILSAFGAIARTGETGAAAIAGGISEALIATALGLGVAIPAVMAYNAFTARINTLSLLLETHALDLTERMVQLKVPAVQNPQIVSGAVASEVSHAD